MSGITVEEAFEHCRRRARQHYENFPVGLFVPKDKQPYVHALYAFARAADDFADEPRYEGMRVEKLDQWEARLHAAYEGRAEDPIFIALAETVRTLDIPKSLLLDLLSAFRQDTVKTRYDSWEEVLDYCRRSADPVGRLVLLIFEHRDPALPPLSDAICTGLQLVNFLQDPPRDLALGRVYLPQNDLARFGVQDDDLAGPLTDEVAALLRFEGDRARSLLEAGLPLGKALPGRAGMSVALYARGGLAALDALERAGWDVFTGRPAPTRWTLARLAALELFRR